MSQLQQQFEREMEIHWCNDQGEPDIDYVNWLESIVEKLTASNSDYTQCAHEWVLIKGNPVIFNTDICVKCHAVRAHSA